MEEQWKDIKGSEGLYQISNLGRVKSLWFGKERIMKQHKNKKGYLRISLIFNKKQYNKRVSCLVWDAFGDKKRDVHVDHIDENKENNRIGNLQLLTCRENNTKRCLNTKSSSKYVGVHLQDNKYWVAQISINNKTEYIGLFKNEHDAHLAYQNKLSTL